MATSGRRRSRRGIASFAHGKPDRGSQGTDDQNGEYEGLPWQRDWRPLYRCLVRQTDSACEGRLPEPVFLLAGITVSLGFQLDTTRKHPDADHLEDEGFIAAPGPDVPLVLASRDTFSASTRADLDTILEHPMGSPVVVYITLATGPLHFELSDCDIVVGSLLKSLYGCLGVGVLCTRPTSCRQYCVAGAVVPILSTCRWTISTIRPKPVL